MIQGIPPDHQHFALFGQMTEDITRLLPADAHLGAVDEELHVHAIVCDSHVCPLVGHVASVGVDRGHFVGTISFKGEEETGVTVPMFTNCLDSKQPTTVAGGVETFVVEAWRENGEESVNMCMVVT